MTEKHHLRLEANHLALREIGPWLKAVFADNGWHASPSLGAVELAVHELATNSVDHAESEDGHLALEAAGDQHDLAVTLRDRGAPFDTTDIADTNHAEPHVRGYGLMIIEQIATSLEYRREGQENTWSAIFTVESVNH